MQSWLGFEIFFFHFRSWEVLLTLAIHRQAVPAGKAPNYSVLRRVAEVAREHGWHPPKSLDSDENFKPEHTLFCRELRFVAIYALFLEIFGQKK